MNGRERDEARQPDRAAHLVVHPARGVDGLVKAEHERPYVAEELHARGRQDKALGPLPDEQLGADLLLELADGRRDRGLRDEQLAGGLGHGPALGRGREVAQLGQGDLVPTAHRCSRSGLVHHPW